MERTKSPPKTTLSMYNIQSDQIDEKSEAQVLQYVSDLVEKHWSVHELPDEDRKAPSFEDDHSNKILKEGFKMRKSGRVQLPCLWKPGQPNFTTNYDYAKKRLDSLMTGKLFRDKSMYEKYDAIFKKWEESGIISRVYDEHPRRKGTYYWPHFPVLKPDSSSTPIRPVFDGAAKSNGFCMNDHIMQGPMLLNDIQDVLLRFRRYDHAVVGDVSEMFLMVELPESDRPYHRFLWYRNNTLVIFEFNRHLFGNKGSPCVAIFAIREVSKLFEREAPEAKETVHYSSVVDDMVDSRPTVKRAVSLVKDLTFVFPKLGMHIRKFYSNSPDVMAQIPPEIRLQKVNEWENVLKGTEPAPALKALGVQWNIFTDKLCYKFDLEKLRPKKGIWNKLTFLALSHSLFDPFGHMTPATLKSKLLIQECWKLNLDWKDKIPDEITAPWEKWAETIPDLGQLEIPRVVFPGIDENCKAREIHVFSDASKEAYAAVAYSRSVLSNGSVHTNLIMSRCKIAPVRSNYSIPRLELLGLEMGAQLADRIVRTYGFDLKHVYLWTDSKTCVDWLAITSKALQMFVKNRVLRIKSLLFPDNVRWVPGDQNPADLPTRGVPAAQLSCNVLWLGGPCFLKETGRDSWPVKPEQPRKISPDDPAYTEIRTKELTKLGDELKNLGIFSKTPDFPVVVAATNGLPTAQLKDGYVKPNEPFRLVENISDWGKMRSLTAWLITWCRLRVANVRLDWQQALNLAEIALAYYVQQQTYRRTVQELKRDGAVSPTSSLVKLRPILVESEGKAVIRLAGRMDKTHLKFEYRCPLLLSAEDPYTWKMVRWHHATKLSHIGGRNALTSAVNMRYYVPGLSRVVRKVINDCVVCRRRDAKPSPQIMAPLPDYRVPSGERQNAFTVTVMDAAGPFEVVAGRGRARLKRWLLIFCCSTTKAVHIEVLEDLSTDGLVMAIESFISLRPKPRVIYCDNQTSFRRLGLEMEVQEGQGQNFEEIRIGQVQTKTNIQFQYGPPNSPHFQGLAEAMVKQVKRAMQTSLRVAFPRDAELRSAAAKITGWLNNLPISYTVKSSADLDLEPLTPAHFLATGPVYEELVSTTTPESPYLKRITQLNSTLDKFWSRLVQECAPALIKYQKWTRTNRDIEVGDIGVLLEKRTPRGTWPLVRVVGVKPSSDKHVRRVTVFDGTHTYERSNRNVAVLLPSTEELEE